MRPLPLLLVLLAASGLSSACATAARPEGMIPAAIRTARPAPPTVNLRTVGGESTALWGRSHISNEAFTLAAAAALEQVGLFRPVIDRAADYELEVSIREESQPNWGVVYHVLVETRWRLTGRGGAVVFEDTIAGRFSATVLDSLWGTRRLRIGKEAAAQQALQEGVRRISKLGL